MSSSHCAVHSVHWLLVMMCLHFVRHCSAQLYSILFDSSLFCLVFWTHIEQYAECRTRDPYRIHCCVIFFIIYFNKWAHIHCFIGRTYGLGLVIHKCNWREVLACNIFFPFCQRRIASKSIDRCTTIHSRQIKIINESLLITELCDTFGQPVWYAHHKIKLEI